MLVGVLARVLAGELAAVPPFGPGQGAEPCIRRKAGLLQLPLVDAALRQYISVKQMRSVRRFDTRRRRQPKRPKPAKETMMSLTLEIRQPHAEPVDLVEIERRARALRAEFVASMAADLRAWVAARLRRQPEGRTA